MDELIEIFKKDPYTNAAIKILNIERDSGLETIQEILEAEPGKEVRIEILSSREDSN